MYRNPEGGIGCAVYRNTRRPRGEIMRAVTVLLPEQGRALCASWAAELKVQRQERQATAAALKALQTRPTPPLQTGAVCTHADGTGHHVAVITRLVGDQAEAVMLSSKPFAARHRRATSDELALTGIPTRGASWWCWVTRSVRDFFDVRTVIDVGRFQ